jgi:hypothetical protein
MKSFGIVDVIRDEFDKDKSGQLNGRELKRLALATNQRILDKVLHANTSIRSISIPMMTHALIVLAQ